MGLAEFIGIATLILAIIGFVATTAYRTNKQINDQVQKVSELEDAKHTRIFERLDEVKKAADEKFVEVKICKILHENNEKQFADIQLKLNILSNDVKKLLAKSGIS